MNDHDTPALPPLPKGLVLFADGRATDLDMHTADAMRAYGEQVRRLCSVATDRAEAQRDEARTARMNLELDLGRVLDGEPPICGFDVVERVRQAMLVSACCGEFDTCRRPCVPQAHHLRDEIERLNGLLNTPELQDFSKAVPLEAAHQRERWGSNHDAGKAPEDWFWLLGYLAGKALHAAKSGDIDKAKHHCISSAAALANWHAALAGASTAMRPGIDPVARGIET